MAAHPDLTHLAREFATFVSGLEGVGQLHVDSLLLCWAAARGERAAAARIDSLLREQTRRLCATMPELAGHAEDAALTVRERLLLAAGAASGVSQYRGRGPLDTWLRTALMREALRIVDRAAEAPAARAPERELTLVASLDADPEVRVLRAHLGAQFRASLRTAIGRLDAGQRSMLRLGYVDGVSIDTLAGLFHVHRATAARRLARARADLLEAAREALKSDLKVSEAELDSLLRGVDSNLSISLGVLLAPEP